MKKIIQILLAVFAAAILVVGGLIISFYLTNRTIDQTIATNISISDEWVEIKPDGPLTAKRQTQEINLEIANFKHDVGNRLPYGQVRLPDGRIVRPEIEAYDELGNQ